MTDFGLEHYIRLIEELVTGAISASDFERRYLELFKNDPTMRPEREFQILDALFADVDAFWEDDATRGPNDLDEAELRRRSVAAMNALKSLS